MTYRFKKLLNNYLDKKKIYVIAEAGVNHNGNIDLAYKLIDAAVSAKVDAVKFQTANPELTQNRKYPIKAPYWAKMMGKDVETVAKSFTQCQI